MREPPPIIPTDRNEACPYIIKAFSLAAFHIKIVLKEGETPSACLFNHMGVLVCDQTDE